MKNVSGKLLFAFCSLLIFMSSCSDDDLSDLEFDLLGEWFVEDFVFNGTNAATNGDLAEMHWIFLATRDFEMSWFTDDQFFVLPGTWRANEGNLTLRLDLDDDFFFFCGDDDQTFDISFFADDVLLYGECGPVEWMEIELEKL